MNLLQEKCRALGTHRLYKGGSSNSNASTNTTENTSWSSSVNTTNTTNIDRRLALQDSVAVGDQSSFVDQSVTYAADAEVLKTFAQAMPDAVKALANAGADVITRAGGAVTQLNRDSLMANSQAWDSTLEYGAAFVDRGIDALSASFGMAQENLLSQQQIAKANIDGAYGLASKTVDSFTPTENKNADAAKYAMLAAALAIGYVFLKDAK